MNLTPNSQYILTTALTFVGSGLGAAIVGAYFTRKLNFALETYKSVLIRGNSIYEKQVTSLVDMHARLKQINSDLASWKFKLEHDDNSAELGQKLIEQRKQAEEALEKCRLYLPKDIEFAIDRYVGRQPWLNKILLSQQLLLVSGGSLQEPAMSGSREETSDLIRDLEVLLNSITDRARKLIHGDPTL